MYTALLAGHLTWNLPMLWILIIIAGMYGFAIRNDLRARFASGQPFLFLLSLVLFYLLMGSPLMAWSHLSFSLHMIQMSVLYFVVPPLFLVGIPPQLFQQFMNIPLIAKRSHWIPKPKWSLLLFSILLLVYHFPIVLNALSLRPLVHNGYIFLLILFSFGMWWPLAAPNPAHRLRQKRKKRYAQWCGALLMPACAFFILSAILDHTSNPFLAQLTAELCGPNLDQAALLPSLFPPKADQALAGFVMLGIHKCTLMATYRLNDKKGKKD